MPTITRNNWHEHCTEPKLSQDEIQELLAMQSNFGQQLGLYTFIQAQTERERAAVPEANPGAGWDQFAVWAAANRRLKRAEIAAWRKWQQSEVEK